MDYEYYYYNARSRYYNACSEITNCENRIGNLKVQRQQKNQQINQLETDLKNHQRAYDQMVQIVASDKSLNTKTSTITNKTDLASVNFSGMVTSSAVATKNLSTVCSEELAATKRTLTSALESLNAKKSSLDTKITDLKQQIRKANSELQEIGNSIKTQESNLVSWRQAKSNASHDMEYYRRKMNEAM